MNKNNEQLDLCIEGIQNIAFSCIAALRELGKHYDVIRLCNEILKIRSWDYYALKCKKESILSLLKNKGWSVGGYTDIDSFHIEESQLSIQYLEGKMKVQDDEHIEDMQWEDAVTCDICGKMGGPSPQSGVCENCAENGAYKTVEGTIEYGEPSDEENFAMMWENPEEYLPSDDDNLKEERKKIEEYDQILKKDPNDSYALYNKSECLHKLNKHREAFDCSDKLLLSCNGMTGEFKWKEVEKFVGKSN